MGVPPIQETPVFHSSGRPWAHGECDHPATSNTATPGAWDIVGWERKPWCFAYGIPWKPMRRYESLWNSMEFYETPGNSMELCGTLLNSMILGYFLKLKWMLKYAFCSQFCDTLSWKGPENVESVWARPPRLYRKSWWRDPPRSPCEKKKTMEINMFDRWIIYKWTIFYTYNKLSEHPAQDLEQHWSRSETRTAQPPNTLLYWWLRKMAV